MGQKIPPILGGILWLFWNGDGGLSSYMLGGPFELHHIQISGKSFRDPLDVFRVGDWNSDPSKELVGFLAKES